jgi:peptide/nickel transport system substrate-binding protein
MLPNTRRLRGHSRVAAGAVAFAVVSFSTYGTAVASPNTAALHVSNRASAATDDLAVGEATAPTTLNPEKLDNGGGDINYAELAYDGFVENTPSNTYAPDLATSWQEVGTGNREYVFHLRPNVEFSDGSTLTAQDAVTTIDAERGSGTTCASLLTALTKVTATGPLTVQLNYSSPQSQASVLAAFSQNYMCGDVVGSQATGTQTDGTGPYMIEPSATVTGSKYTYVPNPNYWNKSLPRYSTVTIDVFSSITEEISAIRTGQVDFIYANGPQAVAAAKTPGLKSFKAPFGALALYITDFDGKLVKALANQKVREALAYAMDRPLLAKALYGGFATPNDEMILPGYQGYVPSYANHYTYNPTKAKELLKQAGYPNGFTFTSIASADVGYEDISQAVASELAAIGVTDKLKQDPTHNEAVIDLFNGKYPAFVWGFGSQPLSVAAPLLFGPQALFNPFHNADSYFVNTIDKADALSGTAANNLYDQVEIQNVNEAYEVVLLDLDDVYLLRPGIVGNVQLGLPNFPAPYGPDIAFWSPPK